MSSSDSSDGRSPIGGTDITKRSAQLGSGGDERSLGGFVDRLKRKSSFRAQEIRRGSLGKKDDRGFASRVAREAAIFEVKATDSTGRAAWYFVKVPRLKVVAFDIATQRGDFDLTDYGEIVESGYGEEIPDDIRERVLGVQTSSE